VTSRDPAGFLRPEVRAWFVRWREGLGGGAVALAGVWLAAQGALLLWIGLAVAAAGGALAVAGVQRGRFRRAEDGAGVVRVVEGQLAYFGPETGGTMAFADLVSVTRADGAWLLRASDGSQLAIPVGAVGADALFDAFAALPGLDPGALLVPGDGAIWRRPAPRPRLTPPARPHTTRD
jgi:hypothetical protein